MHGRIRTRDPLSSGRCSMSVDPKGGPRGYPVNGVSRQLLEHAPPIVEESPDQFRPGWLTGVEPAERFTLPT
jgi:hypothetical protein